VCRDAQSLEGLIVRGVAAITTAMRFIREQKFLLALGILLFFSAVMAVRQVNENQERHAELREALIFLQEKNHLEKAQRVYARLFTQLRSQPTQHLIDDLQRISAISLTNQSPETNLVRRYNLFAKKELERRLEQRYVNANKAAEVAK
jgi:hypothetical protein